MTDLKWASPMLASRFLVATSSIKHLLIQIQEIENDTKTSTKEKLSQIKKIKEEIQKVSQEIDSIKREIMLLNAYHVN